VDFGWNLARDWAAVDPARQAGRVPGWIVRTAAGRPVAWAFGVEHDGERQLGALVAESHEAAQVLLEATLSGALVDTALAFVRADQILTAEVLRSCGCEVQPYVHLVTSVRPGGRADDRDEARVWHWEDRPDTVRLLQEAYAGARDLRPFARLGTHTDWRDYVDALTMRPGCGVFSPSASVVVRDGTALVGVALVTSVGPTTAHVAQLAVAPAARGGGVGRRLLSSVLQRVGPVLGASRCSLLVSTSNQAALRLYARAGFRQTGTFLAARRSR